MKIRRKTENRKSGTEFNKLNNTSSDSFVSIPSEYARLFSSRGNPKPYKGHGYNFLMQTVTQNAPPSEGRTVENPSFRYTGNFTNSTYHSLSELDFVSEPPENDYNSYGTKGISRFSPTRPVMDLGTSLAELRDISQLFSLYRRGAKLFSDMYLDYQFGRGAVVRDIVTLLTIQAKLDKSVNQLIRDNGKTVIRSGQLSKTGDVRSFEWQLTNGQGIHPVLTYGFPTMPVTMYAKDYTSTRWWFSGHFRYYLPELTPQNNEEQRRLLKAKLLGLTPSFSLAWNVLPWTWLIDWFGNFGDILSNIDKTYQYHEVTDSAFVMCEKYYTYEESLTSFIGANDFMSASTIHTSYSIVASLKSRALASPYGFGINPEQFNDTQVAILSALGISKSRGALFHP